MLTHIVAELSCFFDLFGYVDIVFLVKIYLTFHKSSFVIENNISSVIIYNTCPVYKVQTAQNRKYTYFNRLVGVNRVIKRLNNVK